MRLLPLLLAAALLVGCADVATVHLNDVSTRLSATEHKIAARERADHAPDRHDRYHGAWVAYRAARDAWIKAAASKSAADIEALDQAEKDLNHAVDP